jgi:iron(III) transport system substrate-binding protein
MNVSGKYLFPLVFLSTMVSAACAIGSSDDGQDSLVVYSGRSEELVGPVIGLFQDATGISIRVKYGGTAELAATLLEEGNNSPADVYFAQDPGGLAAVVTRLSKLPNDLLFLVPEAFRSDSGQWIGVSGRARVVVFNSDALTVEELPDDIYDFVDPKWSRRIGWAPTNGSFQAMVKAMRVTWGEDRTRDWLAGIMANHPSLYAKNTPTVAAVGAGEVEVGFVNHYYLHRFLHEQGMTFPARNYHPRAGGPGALMMVSGAGVLETASNRDVALRFLEFLVSPTAQQYFVDQTFEYPVIDGIATNPLLTPLDEIAAPGIDMSQLGDLEGTLDLLREVGALP